MKNNSPFSLQKEIYIIACIIVSFTSLHAQNSLDNSEEKYELYASMLVENESNFSTDFSSSKKAVSFVKKYESLVLKAYTKLLFEAEKAEKKLKSQLAQYTFENKNFDRDGNPVFQQKLALATKKYHAHKAMVAGLKSWNLLGEDPTGDIVYFMAENESRIAKMNKSGFTNAKMIQYLIYKMADLYHLNNN